MNTMLFETIYIDEKSKMKKFIKMINEQINKLWKLAMKENKNVVAK